VGSIGVRCVKSHTVLFFHFDVKITKGAGRLEFRPDPVTAKIEWGGLTSIGLRLARRLVVILGVELLAAQGTHFEVRVQLEEDWQIVLPEIVAAVREHDKQAKLELLVNDKAMTQWHERLLRGL